MSPAIALLKGPALRRFLKYSTVGFATFCFDLVLLLLFVEVLGISFFVAVPLGFVIAVSVNYALSRLHVFPGTKRSVHAGYAYFLLSAGLGAFLSTSGVAILVLEAGLHYLPARVMVAGFVGIVNYLFNLHYNFRVMGLHQ
ncbi:MAG TPA: GtrA family protein [Candidatus Paceibacterota bacterium]|nr:GtrA family protein [Candidatus Paceibacterota bacterium]